MAKLTKYTLTCNEKKGTWDLTNDATNRKIKSFATKSEATKGGVLGKAVGNAGGSVKIQKVDGRFQETRTYPPRRAPPPKKARAKAESIRTKKKHPPGTNSTGPKRP